MNFSMLIINNNRSKAYLQNLVHNNFIPNKVIVLNDNNVTLVEHTENDKLISQNTNQKFIRKIDSLDIFFDEKEHILKTLKKNNIKFTVIDNLDINSEEVINEVTNTSDEYIVYSGPSSSILRREILSKNKKFLHVHPGLLPKFRGSTTIYYSYLLESKIGCSVIILEGGIDEGSIVYEKEYKILDKEIDFDYLLDPLVRAKTLVEFFQNKKINPINQKDNKDKTTFYIIHPVLKHLSIMKYNKETG